MMYYTITISNFVSILHLLISQKFQIRFEFVDLPSKRFVNFR